MTWVILLQNINHKLNGQIGIVDFYGFIITINIPMEILMLKSGISDPISIFPRMRSIYRLSPSLPCSTLPWE